MFKRFAFLTVIFLARAFPAPAKEPEAFSKTETSPAQPPSFPNSASFGKCPDGHAALKDVPIKYGLIIVAKNESEQFQKQLANHEFTLGGCMGGDQEYQVTCTRCGFYYNGYDEWIRESSDLESFLHHFSSLVHEFPRPDPTSLNGDVKYTQALGNNQTLQREWIAYVSKRPIAEVRKQMEEWLQKHGFSTKVRESKQEYYTEDHQEKNGLRLIWESPRIYIDLHEITLNQTNVNMCYHAGR